jgi:uncharacterized protein YndB with AHSA1/START domain
MATPDRPGVTGYETPGDREFLITRLVDAPRDLVYACWTDPKHVPHWLLGPPGWTMPVCEIDLRVGGKWHYVWRKADGTEMPMSGTYREIVPGEKVVSTERWGPEWPETINTVALTSQGRRTLITLTVTYASREARDAALKTGASTGMDFSFAKLDELLRKLT